MPMNVVEDISRGGERRAEGRQAIVFSDEHYTILRKRSNSSHAPIKNSMLEGKMMRG